jgi:A/G-specific adenine glycosylase
MQQKQAFGHKILEWFGINQRSLPWRTTRDPYKIWLSEVILQQTRVAQGTAYYNSFVSNFPTIESLANASENQVLKLWQGLGYYSRARNLHRTAKLVVANYEGIFPDNYKALLTLPGIGPYTAAAISSICFGEEKAVVDGNVFRVLSRYFGIDKPINASREQKYYVDLAQQLIQGFDPGMYNQGLMEFGALQCKPQSPDCTLCPLSDTCWAYDHNLVTKFPVKLPKKPVKNRYFNYIVPLGDDNQTVLVQRTKKDIWNKLYEFTLIESETPICKDQFFEHSDLPVWIDKTQLYLFNDQAWHHKLTHQKIHAFFWIAPNALPPKKMQVPVDNLPDFPVHKLIERFLHKFFD